MGEEGAHAVSRGRGFGGILTVFLVPEKSEAAILEAFRRGRMYALQRTPDASLVLTEWSVAMADGGDPRAVSGDTLKLREGTPIEVRVAVDATGPLAAPAGSGAAGLTVALVRNGTVLNGWSGETSVRATHREVFDGRPLVFRIDARARVPHRLVSNPIFVMGGPDMAPHTPPRSSRPGEAGTLLENPPSVSKKRRSSAGFARAVDSSGEAAERAAGPRSVGRGRWEAPAGAKPPSEGPP